MTSIQCNFIYIYIMSQYSQYKVPDASNVLNLNVGQPSVRFLEKFLTLLQKNALNFGTKSEVPELLQYGDIPGFIEYREEILKMLNIKSYLINPSNVFMTNGISQAVQNIASLLRHNKTKLAFDPYDEYDYSDDYNYNTVFVEDPTYFIGLDIFRNLGYTIKTFCFDNIKKLEDDINKCKKSCLIYMIPYHQNPTGKCITEKNIKDLTRILTTNGNTIILSDETYEQLGFDDLEQIKEICTYHENIISLGTFSKIFAPALRLGWQITRNKRIIKLMTESGLMVSSGSVNPYIARQVIDVIKTDDYKIVLNYVRNELKESCDILYSELSKYPDFFEVAKPTGGYFLWVKSLKIDSQNLLKIAQKHKLNFILGSKFSASYGCNDYFRLSFSYYSKDDLKLFGERLNKIVDEIKFLFPVLNVALLGGNGRLGSLIANELKIQNIKYDLLGRDFVLDESFKSNRLIIEVSSPIGTTYLLNQLLTLKYRIPLIIGTTGDLPNELINEYAKIAPVLVSSNFSVGINTINKMLEGILKNYWKSAEILDVHHVHKKDQPSGTAKTFGKKLDQKEISYQIESVREGEVVGFHRIVLKSDSETITIEHNASDRNIFAKGCIEYLKWIVNKENGLYRDCLI